MSHTCFRDEMIFDPEDSKWKCRICFRAYEPPNHQRTPLPVQKYWRPWTIRTIVLRLFRWETHWFPWKDYS